MTGSIRNLFYLRSFRLFVSNLYTLTMKALNSDLHSHNKTKGASAGAFINNTKKGDTSANTNILQACIMLALWRRHTRTIIGIAKGDDMRNMLGGCRSSQFNRRQLIKQRLNNDKANSFANPSTEGGKNAQCKL